jgi:amino acid adenylation domain-containing protein
MTPNPQLADAPAGRNEILPELVARQARLTPDATAVVDGAAGITYVELNSRANQLAHLLRGLGTRPETVVGVCMHRGVNLAVALLAIWRTGGAYLPMDPGQPVERLAWMRGDTGARLVLTQRSLADLVRGTGADPVCLDVPMPVLDSLPRTEPRSGVSPDNAAYVIYTSGSTGHPKGVVVSHAGIANRVMWTVRQHEFTAADRVLHKTSLGFDAAGWEIFAPLVSGGVVAMAPAGVERDPAGLVRAVARSKATVLQVVPSVLRLLVDEPGWRNCTALRLLFSAGEPLHAELCQRLLDRVWIDVWNTYGPTECSIDVTAQLFDPAQQTGPVTIGRPIDGMRALVLDSHGELCPIGIPGELYAGGPGVARGYLGRPGMTAERFVPDPVGPPGTRLYRTGDSARWREDGVLEYLGRIDQQVKVNGVRIEPGEVEAAITAHFAVSRAVVTSFADRQGVTRLVGYVLAEPPLAPVVLRRFVARRLPEHMIPSVFVPMTEFPLTTNGKLDRAALPVPDLDDPDRPDHVAPATRFERLVAQVWTELLGVRDVGVHDDFFQRGGYSLLLPRLAARLRAVSGRHVVLADLFGAPTVLEQAAMLAAPPATTPPVVPVGRADPPRLSFGQERLWFADRLDPGSPEWTVPILVRLPDDADMLVVRRAVRTVVARHEVLRTRYPVLGGEPRQLVDEPGPVEVRVADATDPTMSALFGAEASRGFDLENGPVYRALLTRLPGRQVLLFTVHHIACDGWSSVLLERELRELCAGTSGELPVLPVQYADYAVWQREMLTNEVCERQLGYWRKALDGLGNLELPTDRPRPARRDSRGAIHTFTVPADLTDAVLQLGREHGATPFMTLLTALCTLLARYGRQWDVAVGTPVAGRGRPEVDSVLGFFLNPLVLRPGLTGEEGFGDAVERVRRTSLSAFANQDLPFERLVDELQPERDTSRTPLFQVMFDVQDEGMTGTTANDGETAALMAAWATAKTDLTLVMRRQPDGTLLGVLEYAAALFEPATVARMTGHFVRLLESVTADPATPLSIVDILTAGEQRDLLTWNDTAKQRQWQPVHETIAGHALSTPDAIAVVAGDDRVTYAQLDARANRLAHHLRDLGVGPESVVGVLLSRGPDLVVALLAVWKAGGAYAPFDPGVPPERLGYMLGETDSRVLLTESRFTDRVSSVYQGRQVRIDRDRETIAACPATPVGHTTGQADLAYVIYTSGSTGRPKGIQVVHRPLPNILLATAEETGAGPSSVWLFASSAAFDISAIEMYVPLMTGGRVVVVGDAEIDDNRAQLRLMDTHRVTHVQIPPSRWEMWFHAGLGERPLTAIIGGEQMTADFVGEVRRRVSSLANGYGPTEVTVSALHWHVPENLDTVLLGRPLSNITAHVLDDDMQPLPVGVIGENYIGGIGVSRGYVCQPALTASKFVPDPFGPPGSLLYRTGDLARRWPSGDIEFIGRIDDQVKIRGYRVEPGEVRTVLARHPQVTDAFVEAYDRGGEKQLVAYCVAAGNGLPGHAELAAHCGLDLPEYMVPSLFIGLDRIPFTIRGKVDRQALPAPDIALSATPQQFVAPRNAIEQRIAAIWTTALNARVGVHHNFFQLGGNSVLAARVIAMVHHELDIEIPLRAVFDRPTVAGLADIAEAAIRAEIDLLTETEVIAGSITPKQSHA